MASATKTQTNSSASKKILPPDALASGDSFIRATCGGGRYFPVLLRCPANVLGVGAPSSLADRSHSLRSLYPPQAALPSFPRSVRDRFRKKPLFSCHSEPPMRAWESPGLKDKTADNDGKPAGRALFSKCKGDIHRHHIRIGWHGNVTGYYHHILFFFCRLCHTLPPCQAHPIHQKCRPHWDGILIYCFQFSIKTLMARKDSSLMACSNRQASSAAVSGETPRASSKRLSRVCRS